MLVRGKEYYNKGIEHIHGQHIALAAYLSRHFAGIAPLVSELGYTFVVAQIDRMNKLLQPLASSNTRKHNLNIDVMLKIATRVTSTKGMCTKKAF